MKNVDYIEGWHDGVGQVMETIDEYADQRAEWIAEHLKSVTSKVPKLLILCPFHEEKTPSCMANLLENKFFCLGCAKEGTLLQLAQKIASNKSVLRLV